jgi:hypothetical protein
MPLPGQWPRVATRGPSRRLRSRVGCPKTRSKSEKSRRLVFRRNAMRDQELSQNPQCHSRQSGLDLDAPPLAIVWVSADCERMELP